MHNLFRQNDEKMARHFEKNLDISYFRDVPFLMIPKGARQRSFVDHYLKKNRFTPNIVLEADDNETLMTLVLSSNCVTFSPIALLQRYGKTYFGEKAYAFPINDSSLQQDIIISHNSEKPLSTEAQNCIMLCRELYSSTSKGNGPYFSLNL
jgi:DNA-binding transcriptional LysR family regulator